MKNAIAVLVIILLFSANILIVHAGSNTTTGIDKENSNITISDKYNNILTVNTEIKNTGLNLNRTIIMAVGLVIIMVICIIVTIKHEFFDYIDE